MKLTYNNGETIVTVDGTQDEVFAWYKTFVHSQTVCEQNTDTAFVDLINSKTYDEGAINSVNDLVNDARAGEPDEDGWITWAATDVSLPPTMLKLGDMVEYILRDGYTYISPFRSLNWAKFPDERKDYDIVKFRIVD